MKMVRITAFALVLVLSVGLVAADTVLTSKSHTDAFEMMGKQQPARDDQQVLWLAGQKARADMGDKSFLLRTDLKKAYLLDHEGKKFTAMDLPVDIKKVLPPEAAAQFEQMAPMMKFDVKVTPSAETKKIKTWNAKKYDVEATNPMGMKLAMTLWVTTDIKADIAALKSLNSSYQELMGAADIARELSKIDGVFVLTEMTTSIMGASIKASEELVTVEEKTAPAGHYEPPKDYKEGPINLEVLKD